MINSNVNRLAASPCIEAKCIMAIEHWDNINKLRTNEPGILPHLDVMLSVALICDAQFFHRRTLNPHVLKGSVVCICTGGNKPFYTEKIKQLANVWCVFNTSKTQILKQQSIAEYSTIGLFIMYMHGIINIIINFKLCWLVVYVIAKNCQMSYPAF